MSDLDVRKLAGEDLAEGSFPVSPRADFRLCMNPAVHQGIFQHAKQDTTVEICGVLVGQWQQDENGPHAVIEDFIRCDSATSKFAEVTFTHESWSQINKEMDTRFEEKRIVGWYHSHPEFGIFLSDRDCFIHEHFFSGLGQVAYVVDPVRDLEGMFAWKNGKPSAMPHYWIGNKVCTLQSSTSNPATDEKKISMGEEASRGEPLSGEFARLSTTTALLSLLALFLLGYLLAGWRTSWERQAVIDGVVSQYTDFKLAKIGLREELAEIQKYLNSIASEFKKMPASTKELSPEQQKELGNAKKMIVNSLLAIEQRVKMISDRYGFSDEDRRALLRLKSRLEAKQRRLLNKQEAEDKKPSPAEKDKKAVSGPATEQSATELPADTGAKSPLPETDVLED